MAKPSDETSGETGEDHIWVKEFIQKFQPHNIEKIGEGTKMRLDCPYEDSCKLEQKMRANY